MRLPDTASVLTVTRRTTLFALALLILGCGDPAPTVCTEIDLTAATAAFGIQMECPDPEIEIIVAELVGDDYLAVSNLDAYQRPRYRRIYLTPRALERDDLDLILAHELGHINGPEHSPDPCDVMYHDANGWDPPCIRASLGVVPR